MSDRTRKENTNHARRNALAEMTAIDEELGLYGDEALTTGSKTSVTASEAADILNIPLSYLTKLLGQGELPFQTKGRQRYINVNDLKKYKCQRDAIRRKALEDLAALDGKNI